MGRDHTPTPLGVVGRGLIAGAAGTAAMTVYQTAVAKLRGSEASTTPAEVGKRVIRGVFHRRFDEDHTGALNNAMHWSYGTGWGTVYVLTDGIVNPPMVPRGLAFGTLVWGGEPARVAGDEAGATGVGVPAARARARRFLSPRLRSSGRRHIRGAARVAPPTNQGAGHVR